ncbi:MAG: membrane protein insertase YidC [Pseudomonadota bacterium]
MKSVPPSGPDIKNLMLALLFATAIMFGWQYFYERPRLAAKQAQLAQQEQVKAKAIAASPATPTHGELPVADSSANAPRITINTPSLHGSISLVGARFDDLTLANYHETNDDQSPEVKLLARAATADAYFVELGVLPQSDAVKVPDATTRWQTTDTELGVNKPVTLRWSNGAGLHFERKIAVDEHFMFSITTSIRNDGGAPVTLYPYGLVSRNYSDTSKHYLIMHEGPLGVMNEVLEDITYKKLREDGAQKFDGAKGWVGMTDKYWLTALIPENGAAFDAQYKHFKRGEHEAYQADLRGEAIEVPVGKTQDVTVHVFAGAKVVERLDEYRMKYSIPLFDRAVDFGSLYFLTKPIFELLNYFHGIVGNFGVAILLLTCTIKLLLFPLASKSMTAMSRTKQLMPKVQEIRERHKADKMKMNQEVMALYKREKVNPVSGCLPILLQLPVFYSLYRVLFVTIEMRHAEFFGWIHDLSAPDPTNIFTAFGLIPWATPSFLHLGVWPLVMCATMVVQQRLNPKPADEIQAAVMNYMPFMFLFLFSGFPAGLVIYWAWNNTLTILQQLFINKRLEKKGLR